MTPKDGLWFIGDCLALSVNPERSYSIKQIINSGNIDWKLLVYLSSNQLVLPAFYLNLKRNSLLSGLSKNLISHFEYLTYLNRARNHKILIQIKHISELLWEKGLSPIYIKGAAHLVDGLYEDIAERMLSDIDLLLGEESVINAFSHMLDNGYKPINNSVDINTHIGRHLPRLVKEDEVCAVEIHYRILSPRYSRYFDYKSVKNSLRKPKPSDTFYVFSYQNMILNSILNAQLNDAAQKHYKTFLRHGYDLMLLAQRTSPLEAANSFSYFLPLINDYLLFSADLLSYPKGLNYKETRSAKCYVKRMHFLWKRPMIFRQIGHGQFLFSRISRYIKVGVLFIFSASTRQRVLNNFADPSYLKRHIEQYVQQFS